MGSKEVLIFLGLIALLLICYKISDYRNSSSGYNLQYFAQKQESTFSMIVSGIKYAAFRLCIKVYQNIEGGLTATVSLGLSASLLYLGYCTICYLSKDKEGYVSRFVGQPVSQEYEKYCTLIEEKLKNYHADLIASVGQEVSSKITPFLVEGLSVINSTTADTKEFTKNLMDQFNQSTKQMRVKITLLENTVNKTENTVIKTASQINEVTTLVKALQSKMDMCLDKLMHISKID
jgi:hypothetical protein